MSPKTMQWVKLLVRVLVTGVLLAWVMGKVDLVRLEQVAQAADGKYLWPIWGLTVISFGVNSLKLKWILARLHCFTRATVIFAASAMTSMYSLILPGMVSTAVKWYVIRKDTGDGIRVLGAMVYNQISMLSVAMALGLVTLLIHNPLSSITSDSRAGWLVVGAATMLLVLTLAVWLVLFTRQGLQLADRISVILLWPLPSSVSSKWRQSLVHLTSFREAGYSFHLRIFLVTLGNCVLTGPIVYWLASRASHIEVSFWLLICLWSLLYILGRLPISIANLGVREAILVAILPVYGVEGPAALLMSAILFSTLVFMAFLGGVYHIWRLLKTKTVNDTTGSG